MSSHNRRAVVAEFLGTAFLLTGVVGSGIMGERLAGGNAAIALLANSIATGAVLLVLLTILGPISGAHFNPAVTLVMRYQDRTGKKLAAQYLVAQFGGAIVGVASANVMFGLPPLFLSQHARFGGAQWFSEYVATFGLLLVILVAVRLRPDGVAYMVAAYITAAYWFTSSTSFANPVVTLARAFTDTFSGIRLIDVPGFAIAQVCGAASSAVVVRWLVGEPSAAEENRKTP